MIDGKYYMYGTNGMHAFGKGDVLNVYTSTDLVEWSDPHVVFKPDDNFWADLDFWAPEVHKYNGKYYMFVSFNSNTKHRGTQILVSESPTGPFVPITEYPVTPAEWECLDGTLYVEDGVPYMIFCHEWTQAKNGEVCVIQLSEDLTNAVGEPFLLFRATDLPVVKSVKDDDCFVTDGPFIYRHSNGHLLMIWSSFGEKGYCEAIAYSESGKISGPWKQCDRLLFEKDGGHGMIFKDKENNLKFVMHSPNHNPDERPKIIDVMETENSIVLK